MYSGTVATLYRDNKLRINLCRVCIVFVKCNINCSISRYIRMNRQIQHRQQEMQRQGNDAPRSQTAPSEQAPADVQSADVEESVTSGNEETVSLTAVHL